ncbi:MAG: MFS transporter [Alphaproteobacteria bacterium]|nr:MFS transporter [Alphaproteobacteria bacterium]
MSSPGRILPLVVASALFMENMDSTVIATSLPAMAADLGTSPVALKLAFTTYLLSLTVFLPISAWVSDRYGAKLVFRIAIAVFTLSSLACGWAQNLPHLVLARAVQGLGGAMMVPVGRIIVLRAIPKAELVGALAWLTVPALVGPLVGPPVGGFITTYFSWHWIFWMNLPIGIIGLITATLFMPETPERDVKPLDVLGFVLSGLGLSFTVFGFTVAGRDLLSPLQTLGFVVAGVVLFGLYVQHAKRIAHPILDLSLLRVETLRVSVTAGFFYRVAAGAVPFLLPLLLQLGFNATPFQSGLITCSTALGALTMKFLAARMLRQFGYRQLLLVNGVISCILMAAMGLFRETTPVSIIMLVLLTGGLSRSLQFTALNSIAYADIANDDIARANGLYTVAQQFSLAMGVAVAAIVLEISQWLHGTAGLTQADFSAAFILVAVGGLLSIGTFMKLPFNAGAAMSGHRAG